MCAPPPMPCCHCTVTSSGAKRCCQGGGGGQQIDTLAKAQGQRSYPRGRRPASHRVPPGLSCSWRGRARRRAQQSGDTRHPAAAKGQWVSSTGERTIVMLLAREVWRIHLCRSWGLGQEWEESAAASAGSRFMKGAGRCEQATAPADLHPRLHLLPLVFLLLLLFSLVLGFESLLFLL